MSEIDFVLCKNIQNQLFDLTTNNIMLAEAFLFNDVFSRDATVILFFYRTFCNCLIYRPNQTELYIKYLIDIYQKLNRLQRNTFNKIILGWSFHLPGPNIVHLFVLYRLFDLKLISLNEIIQSMRNFRFANNHIKLNLIYCLIWFAPEIKQKYEHFYQLLLGDLKDFKQNNPHNLLLIELDESSLFRNDFELLKQYRKQGHNHNSLMSIIINDDVLDLQNYIVQFKIDFNQVINPSIFEICPFIQNQPTLIELTAFFGSIKCFKYFLLNGADLESPRNPEENVFHFAIAGGNNEIIHICQQQKLFLIGGLQVAALFHRRSIMDWLIDDVLQNPKECTKTHGTMIQFAAISNHLEALELCFSLKVDVNDGGLNKTALQEACENGNLESVILLLTSKQINLNSCRWNGTALYYAVQNRFNDIVKILLSKPNIDVNIGNSYIGTPIRAACENGDIDMLKLFLERSDIDVNYQCRNNTPLITAIENQNVNIVRVLLSTSKNININLAGEGSPLYIAVKRNNPQIVRLLLSKPEIEVNYVTKGGYSPLFIAAEKSYFACFELLCSHELIDINIKNKDGLTPLHAAVQNSHYDIVKYLCILPGINKDARSNKGYDATHYALNKGDYEMVDILNPEYLLGYNGAYNHEDYDDYDMGFGNSDDDDDDEYFY